MLASIHIADVGIRGAAAALRSTPDPATTMGLRYAETVISSPLGGSVFAPPQPGRVALIAFWDDDAALGSFLDEHRLAGMLADGWHTRLAIVQAHEYHRTRGATDGPVVPGLPEQFDDPTPPDGPAVVLTYARTRPSQMLRLGKVTVGAARPMATAPGMIWASAFVRPPMIATFSLWESPESLEAYAYHSRGHQRAMEADRKKPLHQAGVFFRFQPIASSGQLDSRNPLRKDWTTTPATTSTS